MQIQFNAIFRKKYRKLSRRKQEQCDERIKLFRIRAFDPQLHNHPLKGEYSNFRSINIDGDLRAIYYMSMDDIAIFTNLDSHSNLYS